MAQLFGGGHLIDSDTTDNMGADVTSNWVPIEGSHGVGLEVKVDNTSTASTGTAAGTIAVQVSNSTSNWTALEFSDGTTSLTVSSGTDVTKALDLVDLNWRFLRVFYDRTSGDGILDVYAYVRRPK